MAVQSFQDAHAQLYGNQPNQPTLATPSSGGVSSFQQAHQQLFAANKAKPIQALQVTPPVKGEGQMPTIPPHVKLSSPIDQLKNNIFNGLAKVGQASIDIAPKLPEAHFADKMPFFTPVGFAANLAQGIINTPVEALKANASQVQHIKSHTSTPQQIAADAAAAAQLPLLFISPETSGLKKAGQESVKTALAALGKTSLVGGAFGFLGGLQSGKNITNANDYVKNLMQNVALGTAVGAGVHTTTHIVLPLAKGLPAKVGAVFVKNANTEHPVIDHIQMDAKTAQSVVLSNDLEKTPAGKAILKESLVAAQTDQHVALTPAKDGAVELPSGEKVDISLVKPVDPTKVTPYDTPEIIKARENQGKIADTSLIDTPERQQFREKVATNLYDNGGYAHAERRPTTEVKSERRADIVTGLPASGKNTIFSDPLVKEHGSILVDSDEAKHQIPESNGGTYNGAVHNESNIIKTSVLSKAVDKGHNVVLPLVGGSEERMKALIAELREHGYSIHLHHSEISVETSIKRSGERFTKSGKFVDPAYIMHDVKLRPNENYDRIKSLTDTYEKHSNEAEGEKPKFIEKGTNAEQSRSRRDRLNGSNASEKNKTEAATPSTVKPQTGNPTNQAPVGTGKIKESRAYKRLVQYLQKENPEAADAIPGKTTYHRVNLQDQAEKAITLLEKDPQKAFNIAKGLENPPEGMLRRPITLALADRAREEKNWKLFADIESNGSLTQTRLGQEIVVDRGRFNDNSTHTYVSQLLDARLRKLGKNAITEGIDTARKAFKQTTSSAKANAVAKIDRATAALQKELRQKQAKIQSAQSILDALTCK